LNGHFLSIYRAECLLGFIIGMTFTSGALPPLGIGLVFSSRELSGGCLVLFRLVGQETLFVVSKMTRLIPSDNNE
jgi:hypothetical protein